jgi:hypothetical protein
LGAFSKIRDFYLKPERKIFLKYLFIVDQINITYCLISMAIVL